MASVSPAAPFFQHPAPPPVSATPVAQTLLPRRSASPPLIIHQRLPSTAQMWEYRRRRPIRISDNHTSRHARNPPIPLPVAVRPVGSQHTYPPLPSQLAGRDHSTVNEAAGVLDPVQAERHVGVPSDAWLEVSVTRNSLDDQSQPCILEPSVPDKRSLRVAYKDLAKIRYLEFQEADLDGETHVLVSFDWSHIRRGLEHASPGLDMHQCSDLEWRFVMGSYRLTREVQAFRRRAQDAGVPFTPLSTLDFFLARDRVSDRDWILARRPRTLQGRPQWQPHLHGPGADHTLLGRTLDAFSHYCYAAHRAMYVATSFEYIQMSASVLICGFRTATHPQAIYSVFRPQDDGWTGLQDFAKVHRCNEICKAVSPKFAYPPSRDFIPELGHEE